MIDKTTVGVTAEQEEVEAVLHNLCGYHLAERDPVFRYTVLTREQVLYDALVAAIKRERGRALSELVNSGTTMTAAAAMTNLTSRQQVQRLIAIAKAADEAAAHLMSTDTQAAASDFEDRLAAVEATLDEVVSGIAPPTPEPEPVAEVLVQSDDVAEMAQSMVAATIADEPGEYAVPVIPGALTEATQSLPALATVIQPTRDVQMPDDSRWWRRSRDSGAA